MAPTLENGKVCYIEMPATDIGRSADFYQEVFGWRVRQRGDGHTAFDDTTGEVSGAWVRGRVPASGCEIVQPVGVDAPEITARFRDPGGNVIGLYQQPNDSADG